MIQARGQNRRKCQLTLSLPLKGSAAQWGVRGRASLLKIPKQKAVLWILRSGVRARGRTRSGKALILSQSGEKCLQGLPFFPISRGTRGTLCPRPQIKRSKNEWRWLRWLGWERKYCAKRMTNRPEGSGPLLQLCSEIAVRWLCTRCVWESEGGRGDCCALWGLWGKDWCVVKPQKSYIGFKPGAWLIKEVTGKSDWVASWTKFWWTTIFIRKNWQTAYWNLDTGQTYSWKWTISLSLQGKKLIVFFANDECNLPSKN